MSWVSCTLLSWRYQNSPILVFSEGHKSYKRSFIALGGQHFGRAAHVAWWPRNHTASSSLTMPALWSLRPASLGHQNTPSSASVKQRVLGGALALRKMPEQKHSFPTRGKAWEGSFASRHIYSTTGILFFFCKLKITLGKQLTLFNVKVNCLLPTMVSDTLNVPFFASSFKRSSRVLLQEIGGWHIN